MPATGIYREITMPSIAEAWFPSIEDAPPMSSPARRSTDVSISRISLTVPMAIGMAVFVAAMVGGFWAALYSQSATYAQAASETASDVRDIKTRLEMKDRVDEAETRADTLVDESMKQSIDELRRQMQLLQLQYAELSKQIARK